MDAMTDEQRTTKAPIEDILLFTAQQLTETAYDRFTEGAVSQIQLKEFYEAVRDWSRASEQARHTGMRPRKTDANQAGIIRALNQVPGVSVADTHSLGKGFPDICIGHKGNNYFFELKNPSQPRSAQQLTDAETRFHTAWKGRVLTVTNLDEILAAMDINGKGQSE